MSDFDPIGKWEKSYLNSSVPRPYGPDETYKLAARFLDDGNIVEDWGCGYAFARQFFSRSRYVGIDGSKSQQNDITDDLRTRKSKPDNILIRGVLEHNTEWRTLLKNASGCAQKKLCIVFFMDFLTAQGPIQIDQSRGIVTFQLCEKDVDEQLSNWSVVKQHVESTWHIWYCTKTRG